jgi:hypothetical protein
LFVKQPIKNVCWICGATAATTHEHKFKASSLRQHFGNERLTIQREGVAKFAQGINSSYLKYQSKICEQCNSSTTQESDIAYDTFVANCEPYINSKDFSSKAWEQTDFREGQRLRNPLFRYFGKLLGCHLADIKAPIPTRLCRFVEKKSERNCIWLGVRRDVEFDNQRATAAPTRISYAAQGGLVIIAKKPKLFPITAHSTVTIGSTQFIYYLNFTTIEILEMRLRFPHFIQSCAEDARLAIDAPIPADQRKSLGL